LKALCVVRSIATTSASLPDYMKGLFIMEKYMSIERQELSMFVDGVMAGQMPPMVEVSNEVRVHKAGFDKWSFRKKVR